MYNDSARQIIAKPLALRTDQTRDDPRCVKHGEGIHDTQQVTQDGLLNTNGPAGILDDSQMDPALSRRLAVPYRLKKREITEFHKKQDKN